MKNPMQEQLLTQSGSRTADLSRRALIVAAAGGAAFWVLRRVAHLDLLPVSAAGGLPRLDLSLRRD